MASFHYALSMRQYEIAEKARNEALMHAEAAFDAVFRAAKHIEKLANS
jgi:hypothetical protein